MKIRVKYTWDGNQSSKSHLADRIESLKFTCSKIKKFEITGVNELESTPDYAILEKLQEELLEKAKRVVGCYLSRIQYIYLDDVMLNKIADIIKVDLTWTDPIGGGHGNTESYEKHFKLFGSRLMLLKYINYYTMSPMGCLPTGTKGERDGSVSGWRTISNTIDKTHKDHPVSVYLKLAISRYMALAGGKV